MHFLLKINQKELNVKDRLRQLLGSLSSNNQWAPRHVRQGEPHQKVWLKGGKEASINDCPLRTDVVASCSLKTLIRNLFFFADASFSCVLIIELDKKSQKKSKEGEAHRHRQCSVLMEPLQPQFHSGTSQVVLGHQVQGTPTPASEFLGQA